LRSQFSGRVFFDLIAVLHSLWGLGNETDAVVEFEIFGRGLRARTDPANAATIYSEDFNNPGFLSLGNSSNIPVLSFSDKYASTDYYLINDFNNWSFTGDAWYALSGTDGAVLLNEGGGPHRRAGPPLRP